MTSRLHPEELLTRVTIVAPPVITEQRSCRDQNFGLPTRIYAVMFGLFVGAIAVMALAFRGNMGVTYAVLFAFLIAFFGVPLLFVKAAPPAQSKALAWSEFREKGIATATGQTPAVEAVVLALALPAFIFAWAVAVALIAHFVG